MDTEEVKILILEKLFNDIIPKIIISDKIFNPNRNYWTYSHNDENHGENIITYISFSILIDNVGNFESFSIYTRQQRRIRHNDNDRRLAILAGIVPQINEIVENNELELRNINEEFKNKNLAIKKICELMNINKVINLVQSAKKELERIESVDGMHIGTIKDILNIPLHLDITNLETRKVLLEKFK